MVSLAKLYKPWMKHMSLKILKVSTQATEIISTGSNKDVYVRSNYHNLENILLNPVVKSQCFHLPQSFSIAHISKSIYDLCPTLRVQVFQICKVNWFNNWRALLICALHTILPDSRVMCPNWSKPSKGISNRQLSNRTKT